MSYLGATTTDDAARLPFLAQFTGNDLYRDSDTKYGENILVFPYKITPTAKSPNTLWYKVSNTGYATLDLKPTDELYQWVNVGGQYYVKASYLDMMGYQPVTDSMFSAVSNFDFMKYLPYFAAGGAALLLVLLLRKKG